MWAACARAGEGKEKNMLIDIFDKLVNELYFSDRIIPFYTLACIAFWYVVFLALFDIMELLTEIFRDYIKPFLIKMIRKLILKIYLRYLDLSDRVRFYQDKKEIKSGSVKELEDKQKTGEE